MIELNKIGKNSPKNNSKFPLVGSKLKAVLIGRQGGTPKNNQPINYVSGLSNSKKS